MDWKRILEQGEERKVRGFLRNNPRGLELAKFISALGEIDKNRLSRRSRRFLEISVISKLKKRLQSLEPDDYWVLLKNIGTERTLKTFVNLLGAVEDGKQATTVCGLVLRALVRYGLKENVRESIALFKVVVLLFLSPAWPLFLEASIKEESGESRNLLFHWWEFFHQMTTGEGIILEPLPLVAPADLDLSRVIRYFFLRADGNIHIPIPKALHPQHLTLAQRFREEINEKQEEELRFLLWFQDNGAWFQQAWNQMWQDIEGKRLRGIRPELDFIKIGVKPLLSADLRFLKIQYLAEEIELPSVTARLHWEFIGESSSFEKTLRPGELQGFSDILPQTDPRQVLDMVLSYIALHSYWKIVTRGKKNPLATRPPTGVRPRGSALPKEWTEVRWHFRRISGQPSQRAKNLSQEIAGIPIPEGKTFVSPHQRKVGSIKEEEPLFVYKESELGYPTEEINP